MSDPVCPYCKSNKFVAEKSATHEILMNCKNCGHQILWDRETNEAKLK